MKPLDEQTTSRLQNRLRAVIEYLRAKEPLAVAEMEHIQAILANRSHPDGPLSIVRTPRPAIRMLLTELGQVELTKKQIYALLQERGFPIPTTTKKMLVNDAINDMIERGELERVSGERGDTIVRPTAALRVHD